MYILPQLNMKDVDYIADQEKWCYSLPRKILNYRTPDEVFEDKLDLIFRQTASCYGFLVINVQLIIAIYVKYKILV